MDGISEEIAELDKTAHSMAMDLVKYNYSYQSMLYFSSQIQWYIFNIELIRNELESNRERDMQMMCKMFRRDE